MVSCTWTQRQHCSIEACLARQSPVAAGSPAEADTAPAPAASTPMSAASLRVLPPPNCGSQARSGLGGPVPSPSIRRTRRRRKWPCLIPRVSHYQVPPNPAQLLQAPLPHQVLGSQDPNTQILHHPLFEGKCFLWIPGVAVNKGGIFNVSNQYPLGKKLFQGIFSHKQRSEYKKGKKDNTSFHKTNISVGLKTSPDKTWLLLELWPF